MNSWTRCFVAALLVAGIGAVWLVLDAPPGQPPVAAASGVAATTPQVSVEVE